MLLGAAASLEKSRLPCATASNNDWQDLFLESVWPVQLALALLALQISMLGV